MTLNLPFEEVIEGRLPLELCEFHWLSFRAVLRERVNSEMQGQVEDGALEMLISQLKQPYPLGSDPLHSSGPLLLILCGWRLCNKIGGVRLL